MLTGLEVVLVWERVFQATGPYNVRLNYRQSVVCGGFGDVAALTTPAPQSPAPASP